MPRHCRVPPDGTTSNAGQSLRPGQCTEAPLPCAGTSADIGIFCTLSCRPSLSVSPPGHPLRSVRSHRMLGRDHALSGALAFAALAPTLHVVGADLVTGIAL